MTIKRVLCVLSLTIAAAWVSPYAGADASHVYQYCLNEGIKAFEQQRDEDASRYFQWAHQLDPSAQEPSQYLGLISSRKRSYRPGEKESPSALPYFEEILSKGKQAMTRRDYDDARQYFNTARLLDPEDPQPLQYLEQIDRLTEKPSLALADRSSAISRELDKLDKGQAPAAALPSPRGGVTPAALPSAAPVTPVTAPRAKLPASFPKKAAPDIITLDEIMNAATGGRASIKIEMGSSVIIEGRNIEKFLIVNEGVVTITKITRDQIKVDVHRWGSTFVHIWDESGGGMARRTIYVEGIIPHADVGAPRVDTGVEHAAPFRVRYSNDWSAYYYGPDMRNLKRQKPSYQQHIGVEGETPYGFFDASAGMVGYEPVFNVTTYTAGLSGIPLDWTRDFNIRIFDASRRLSPLTLPGTGLFGAYLDVNLFKEIVGLSVTHGQQRGTFGYFSQGGSGKTDSYIDAGKIILFPKDPNKRYALNYAQGSGSARDSSLTKQVYSVEGQQRMGRMTLNGELARDDRTTASLAGMQWKDGQFRTGLNFRDMNKEFTTITGTAPGQGEIGATWTMNTLLGKADTEASLDVYRDRIDFNPEDPQALNYDSNVSFTLPLNEKYSLGTGVHYAHTPGELSPRRYMSGDMRLTRIFPVWSGRTASWYAGHVYQRSRFSFSPTSEYDRYGLVGGLQVPLTGNLSWTAGYEYSWLDDLESGIGYNPHVFNTTLSYSRQFTDRLAGNFSASYRNEEGIGGNNSFLAGEDSVEGSAGFVYSATEDVDLFMDSRVRDVWAQVTGNPSYHALDIRLGMRAVWGSPLAWDPEGTVEGVVFKDKNANGKFDKEEEGFPNIKVKVGEKHAVTNSRGWYHMKVRAKRATVSPVMESVPNGYTFSTPTFQKVDIRPWLRDRVDFGLTTQAGVFGVVFVDKNGNGQPDPGDQFISRVKMVLDGKTRQMSDARGAYFFKKVDPGKHILSIDMASVPMNFVPAVKIKNEIVMAEGVTYIFHVPMNERKPQEQQEPEK